MWPDVVLSVGLGGGERVRGRGGERCAMHLYPGFLELYTFCKK